MTAPVVVQVADQRALLAQVLDATGAGTPCAVLDVTWPAEVLASARASLRDAADGGDLTSGDLVLFTSGSTARPRPVARTVASWRASVDPLRDVLELEPDDVVWLPGPLWSSLFLYGAWHASVLALDTVLRDESPDAATVVHCVPTQVPDLLQRRGQGELAALRLLVVAGDRLARGRRRDAERLGLRVVEYYGAAELSFVAWRDDDGPLRAFPRVELEVRAGVLWARSPYLARGYLGPADGPFRRDDARWATVGDLASEHPGGVEVLGRGTSAITTGGHTVVVEDVEHWLRRLRGVTDAAVLGVPHARLGQALVAVVVGDVALEDLRRASRELPSASRPRRWLRAGALPRSSAGKLRRHDLLDLAAAQLRWDAPRRQS
ncbi:MAG: class I adenylate-forming enzyme family protein [Actinomycetes bacterium]